MITVTITGDDAQAIVAQMHALLYAAIPSAPVAATAELTAPPQDNAKPKRGRPAKEKSEDKEPAPATSVGAMPAPAAPTAEQTPDELVKIMKTELMDLAKIRPGEPNEQAGWARVGVILSKYGYQRFNEIKPTDYHAIIKEARVANGRATA